MEGERLRRSPARYPETCREVGAGFSGRDAPDEYLLRHLPVASRIAHAFVEKHSRIPDSRVIFHKCTFAPGALTALLKNHCEIYFVSCHGLSLSDLCGVGAGITRLGLAKCFVTDDVLPVILMTFTSLEYLDLSHNSITDEGLFVLAGVIGTGYGLMNLRLVDLRFQRRTIHPTNPLYAVSPASPPISETGGRAVLDAVARAIHLPDILLDGNGDWMWPEWTALLAEAFPPPSIPSSENEYVWNLPKRIL